MNLRSSYLFIIVWFLSFNSFAQLTDFKQHFQSKYSAGILGTTNYQALSFNLEFHTKKRIGLLYNLDFIFRPDNIKQVHSSVGSILGPPILGIGILAAFTKDSIKDSDLDFGAAGIALGIIMFVLPDGINYHFPLSYRLDVAPYVNILGVDYMRDRNVSQNYLKWGVSLGTKLNYWSKSNFTFSAFVETRGLASYGWSFGGGFGIGYAFNKRTKDELEN